MASETAVPVAKPPQMSDNPARRVAEDLLAEWRGGGGGPPPPGGAYLAPPPPRAPPPPPPLRHPPPPPGRPRPAAAAALRIRTARADLQPPPPPHAGRIHARPRGQPFRHRRPPGELPLARVELRRPDPAARRRPADDRRRLP